MFLGLYFPLFWSFEIFRFFRFVGFFRSMGGPWLDIGHFFRSMVGPWLDIGHFLGPRFLGQAPR